jgi:hypothetical protein
MRRFEAGAAKILAYIPRTVLTGVAGELPFLPMTNIDYSIYLLRFTEVKHKFFNQCDCYHDCEGTDEAACAESKRE